MPWRGRPRMPGRLRGALAWVAAAGVLAAVFALYTRPDFLVTLADQLWACF